MPSCLSAYVCLLNWRPQFAVHLLHLFFTSDFVAEGINPSMEESCVREGKKKCSTGWFGIYWDSFLASWKRRRGLQTSTSRTAILERKTGGPHLHRLSKSWGSLWRQCGPHPSRRSVPPSPLCRPTVPRFQSRPKVDTLKRDILYVVLVSWPTFLANVRYFYFSDEVMSLGVSESPFLSGSSVQWLFFFSLLLCAAAWAVHTLHIHKSALT